MKIYHLLFEHFGPQGWWPGDTRFEVIVGAILTQNTAWSNVEKAIRNLKSEGILNPRGIFDVSNGRLEELVRPSGYFRVKTRRLKAFINYLYDVHDGSLDSLFSLPLNEARVELLDVYGIGPETADSILLYAGEKAIFPVDAYKTRVFHRLGELNPQMDYDAIQRYFQASIHADIDVYKEYHALLVAVGKNFCRPTKPVCPDCPLSVCCFFSKENSRQTGM